MKKSLSFSFLLAVLLTTSFLGFSQAYEKGDKLLNVGIGLNSYYSGLPIGATYEVGITDVISVGGQVDYTSGDLGSYAGYSSGYTAFYVGARGSYHFNKLLKITNKKLDVYAGLGLGYQSFKYKDSYLSGSGGYGSGLYLNYFIGGKYYFSNKIGGFLELGSSGLSNARVGVAFKF